MDMNNLFNLEQRIIQLESSGSENSPKAARPCRVI